MSRREVINAAREQDLVCRQISAAEVGLFVHMRLHIGISIIFIETVCKCVYVCVAHTVSVWLQASKSLYLLRTLHMYIASVLCCTIY